MYRGVNRVTTSVTALTASGVYDVIITAASGYQYELTQITAVNQQGATREITLYDGWTEIMPGIPLGASGTVILGNQDLGNLDGGLLTASSGLRASIDVDGTIDLTVYYVTHDERTPIAKYTARWNSYNDAQVIRTPNRRGEQQES